MEEFEQYIYDNNIRIDKMKLEYCPALYVKYKGLDCIAIDYSKIQNKIEERCIIAHEIAHQKTGTIYDKNTSIINKRRAEYRADKRMIYDIIPLNDLKSFIMQNKPQYKCEIAEEFGVTEELIEKTLKIYNLI